MTDQTITATAPGYAAEGPSVNPQRGQLPAAQTAGSLAMRNEGWTDDQRATLRAMGLEHADEGDLRLFHHYATRTGLDPFTRQVYMVGRNTEITVRERNEETGNERDVKRRVTKFTIQVGIDGWRVLGNRAAHRDGVRVGHKAPLYAGKDGVWSSIWLADAPPVACEYTLTADGVEVVAVCYFSEYAQYSGRGDLTSMWQKMPLNQLAKCTEALAWRKAFPADFAGLVLEDAAQAEVIDGEIVDAAAPAKAAPRKAGGATRNAERAARAQRQADAPDHDPEAERIAAERAANTRRKWLNRMFDLLGAGNVKQRDDQLVVIAELGELDRIPEHRDGISDEVLVKVVKTLNDMSTASQEPETPSLETQLDDVMRKWETRQAEADQ
jgi:phage recombination protein Bet